MVYNGSVVLEMEEVMTCIVSEFRTKKDLKERVQRLNEDATRPDRLEATIVTRDFYIEDPSVFKPRYFSSSEIKNGQEEVVTNHPKRSWFAAVGRKGGQLYVK